MKKLSLILACSLLTSSVALPIEQKTIVKDLETKYTQLKTAMHDYWNCLKGNKECDPARIKRVRIAAGILVAAVGATGVIAPKIFKSIDDIKKDIIKYAPKPAAIGIENNGYKWVIYTNEQISDDNLDTIVYKIKIGRLGRVKSIVFKALNQDYYTVTL